MLTGFANRQLARNLARTTVEGRENTVKAFAAYVNTYPWLWTPAMVDEWLGDLRSLRDLKRSTIRSYSESVRAFCHFITDPLYGRRPSGPGAQDLLAFFASVERQLEELDVTAPTVKRSDQELINLLAIRAGALHLGLANHCWFLDPGKALCLKLARSSDRSRPLVGMCDSARCQQATHHSCHRIGWATSAVTSPSLHQQDRTRAEDRTSTTHGRSRTRRAHRRHD